MSTQGTCLAAQAYTRAHLSCNLLMDWVIQNSDTSMYVMVTVPET